MLAEKILFLGLLVWTSPVIGDQHGPIAKDLEIILSTLEAFTPTKNDVVFLLDESGSIYAHRFPHVKVFTKLTVQRLPVSAEETRVAVVTFSSGYNTHIDYISNPYGKNMCTLLKEIDYIQYSGGGTETAEALQKAEDILAKGRPGSKKIVVLLTDGRSNDGRSTIAVSNALKQRGITIFAVGVAEVNVEEINAVASSSNHIYILKNFDYIVQVNIRLVNDTKDVSLELATDNSYCEHLCSGKRDCCDANANCYCGTRTGKYDCACSAGYQGKSGYKEHCHKCPKSSYKSESRNADCEVCPAHSTTQHEGSTSVSVCTCDIGYEKMGNACKPVRCASLSAPEGGILIPTHCNNTFGSHCSFKCREGYCPLSCSLYKEVLHSDIQHQTPPIRTCLETRVWSGEEFHCEKMTCPTLPMPENGMHNCSETDFTFGTTCSFQCDKGYELSGSKTRTCVYNSWTGDEVNCEVIHCAPLKTSSLLHVKPTMCGSSPMSYKSICQYHCSDGYTLEQNGYDTDGILRCEADKKWSGVYSGISCRDNEPPKIRCPDSIESHSEPHKGYTRVEWNYPKAEDNVPRSVVHVRLISPKNLQKSPSYGKKRPSYYFPIGRTEVIYEAIDHSKLSNTCSFYVKVLDNEPPKVVFCPGDIEIYHHTIEAIPVHWIEPIFEDNSKKLKSLDMSHKSGDTFGWGPPVTVYYNATDEANNTACCSFQVKVKHYPCHYYAPPVNGLVICDNRFDSKLCSVFCHDGFEFAEGKGFQRTYMCKQVARGNGTYEGKWEAFQSRRFFKMPWPDCSRPQKPTSLNTTVGLKYGVDSCSPESLKKFRALFWALDVFKVEFFCPKNRTGCSPGNLKIACIPASSHNYGGFNRRGHDEKNLTINFNVQVFLPETTDNMQVHPANKQGFENDIYLSSSPFMKQLEGNISLHVKDTYNINNEPVPEVHYNILVVCSVGQISVNNTCVNCPAGTYKDVKNETCAFCPTATYQDEERQLSCKACPVGFTTYEVKSKSADDCKGPCQPGTFSATTFEPCLPCPLNTYQRMFRRKQCNKCPPDLYTWRVGAKSSRDCVAPCKPGTFSDTGYEPCNDCEIGSYQSMKGQTDCTVCPNRTTTGSKHAENFEDCIEFDICAALRPCLYDAPCIQHDKDYECLCPEGLMGKHCEINLDDCASAPCLNARTCVDGIGNFTCLCLEGWTGSQCQTNVDDCNQNLCLNDAKCVDKVNSYNCECQPGFSGDRCERNINDCESNPCHNNGTCFDMQNGYRCCCPENFYGPSCEKELIIEMCDSVNCQNGGTCLGDEESFNCTCPSGFEGEFCELNIDNCWDHECENGGICIDGIDHATCSCPKNFTGSRCETALVQEYVLTFPTSSTTNFVELKNPRRLYAVTVAFFMRTSFRDANFQATPISYSYKYQDHLVDNALTLLDTNNFVLYIHGKAIHTEFTANRDSSWHHYAITWEKMGGKWAFYVDGKTISSGLNIGEDTYMHPGTFVLGQDQDEVGSLFSVGEAFAGDITEFNVWDYSLTSDEIRKISFSCGYVGNVIPWYIVSQYANGDVKISDEVDKCKDIGHCQDTCDCGYTNLGEEHSCKNEVNSCTADTCANGQPCVASGQRSFCSCDFGFDGRHCEYDIDECLDKNGGCDYTCVNDVGTGSYHCECPDDMILSDDGKTCKDTDYCSEDGQTYVNGETWDSNCKNCTCDRGNILCEDITCSVSSCNPEETLITSPGECCSKCVSWSFCILSPDSTIVSFDLTSYKIDDRSHYTAIEECIEGRFKVQIETYPNGKDLVIYQDCSKVTMSSDGSVLVGDDMAELPLKNELWNVEEVNASVVVRTNSDLIVEWDFTNDVVIAVPVSDAKKMCGFCSKTEEQHAHNTGHSSVWDSWLTAALIRIDILNLKHSGF